MGLFISYSRRDARAVQVLATDLGRTRNPVWMDRELGGGEDWWHEILRQIRDADVFVIAVSTHSLRSRPCLTELEYAIALGVPILPVQVGDVDSYRTSPIAEKQVLDYRARIGGAPAVMVLAEPAIDLVVAVADVAARRGPLPEPLPAAPPIPFEYLMQLRLAVDAPEIPSKVQLQILTQLKQAARDEEDAEARRDVVDLLQRLRRHPDTTYRNAVEIDELLAQIGPIRAEPAPSPEPPPKAGGPAADPKPPPAREPVPPRAEAPQRFASTEAAPGPSTIAGGSWSTAAIGLGALGLGQLPLLWYSLVYGTVVRSNLRAAFAVTFVVVLALTLVGAALGVAAIRRNERPGRLALTVAALGFVIVAVLLIDFWFGR